jgi:ADP-heptose:LPS heptosyltransferase
MSRTLVIQLGRLGDVIQTTPLLIELAAAGDQLDVLVLTSTHTALLGLSAIHTIITIPDKLKPLDDAIACGFPHGNIPAEAHELLADLQLPLYDRVINASHATLGCWLAATIPCANPDSPRTNPDTPHANTDAPDANSNSRHGGVILDRECLYLGPASAYRVASLQFRQQNLFNLVDLIRAIPGAAPNTAPPNSEFANVAPQNIPPRLYVNQAAELPFALPGGRRVALNPGASEPARCWPAENFVRLAETLSAAGFAPLLVGAPSDHELCEKIAAAARIIIPNFAGRTTIPEMAALLARCELLVSADTGAAHLAAAANTTVLGLYGASAWFAETAPYGNNHLILQTRLNAPMSAISVDSAVAAALNRLGRLSLTDLRSVLQRQNQSAWQTSIDPPSPTDPLGGLTYTAIHAVSPASHDNFAHCLRHSFATEFLAPTNSSAHKHSASHAIESAPTPGSAGVPPAPPQPSTPAIVTVAESVSLTDILIWMETVATLCADSTRNGMDLAEIHVGSNELIAAMDRLRLLTSDPAWNPLSSIIHNLDWQLRMLPPQPLDATFRSHAQAYASAARILRNANAHRRNDAEQDNLTQRKTYDLKGFTAKGRKEGGQVPSSVRIQAPARQRGSVSP